MRRIRWKPTYQRVDRAAGGAVADLVARLNRFAAEADGVSHCQDLTDLHERLRALLRERVEHHQGEGLVATVRAELDTGLPLDARDGPACTACGMCDALEQRLHEWAESAEDQDAGSGVEADPWRRSA